MDHHGVDEHPKTRLQFMVGLPFSTKRERSMLFLSPCRLLGFKMPNLATELNSHENNSPMKRGHQLPEMSIEFNIPIRALFLSVHSGCPRYLSEVCR